MHSSNKHSTLKGILITLGFWSWECLRGKPYVAGHKMHGRPDAYKNIDRDTIRRPPDADS